MTDRGAARSEPGQRVVLITGASSGIGAATAELAARLGDVVGIVARRRERLDEVLQHCRNSVPECAMWVADLGDPSHAVQIAEEATATFGRIDVLVNNAAVPMRRTVPRLTMGEVERTMRVNFLSPVAMTMAVLPAMLDRGSGTVVNVSSLGGRLGIATEAAYCASKFALAGWSEAMAADLWSSGVKVRLVLPGAIDTEIWDQPGNDPPLYRGPLEPAEQVAAAIMAAIDSDRFEHYVPDMRAVVEMKTADPERYLEGMMELQRQRHEGDEGWRP